VPTRNFPIRAEILDLIAEADRVMVRNRWAGTEAPTGKKFEHRQLVERWAYLTPPQPANP